MFRHSGRVVSLLVADGTESIGVSPELLPIDGSFQVASFATGRHVAFVVSDLSPEETTGFARALVEPVSRRLKIAEKMGMGSMRLMTDVSAERYWTVVTETEVENLEQHAAISRKAMQMPEFQEAMKGYHDVVDHGRREIYLLEK